jgi:uncharacterized protein (DUF305 family)
MNPPRNVACDKTSDDDLDIVMRLDQFVSETGMYKVKGCDGVAPKLRLAAGKTYTFHQNDPSQWMHPVGFAWVAAGALSSCVDGEEGACPELDGEQLQYNVRGKPVNIDDSGFGLDEYEPQFKNSQDWWQAQAAVGTGYTVELKIPKNAPYQRFYGFCHIHKGLSFEIEVVGHALGAPILNANQLGGETQAQALEIYRQIQLTTQADLDPFDLECGTWNAEAFHNSGQCSDKHFLCGAEENRHFEQCLEAIDCQMHYEMAVEVPKGSAKFATFARQMIPHHANAVAMSKVALKHIDEMRFGSDEDKDWAHALFKDIIAMQNMQIQEMQDWLDAYPLLAGKLGYCYDEINPNPDRGSC